MVALELQYRGQGRKLTKRCGQCGAQVDRIEPEPTSGDVARVSLSLTWRIWQAHVD